MKMLNILSFTATFFLAILVLFLLNLAKPMEQQYDALVEKIMDENGFTNEPEMLKQFPELLELKDQIRAIQKAHHQIQQVAQHPIPPGKEKSSPLLDQIKNLKVLEEKLQLQMDQGHAVADREWAANL